METELKIVIPTDWSEITTSQYIKLMSLNLNSDTIKTLLVATKHKNLGLNAFSLLAIGDTEIDKLVSLLSILLNVDSDVLFDIDSDVLFDIITELEWIKPFNDTELINANIEFNKFSVGRWINCEVAIDKGIEKNLQELINGIYDTDKGDACILETYQTVLDFLEYRRDLFSKFPNLFNNKTDNDEVKTKEEMQKEHFYKVYTWHQYLYNLANGDVLRMEAASELNFVFSLNHLNYLHNKEKLIPLKDKF